MAPRPDLQAIFVNLLGSNNVYFQPPPSIQLNYPCIIYKRDTIDVQRADDIGYAMTIRYMVTYIDRNPDSPIVKQIMAMPMCRYDRFYTADNLNHDVFQLFF